MNNQAKTRVGVVIGRFQCHNLHEGHQFILDTAKAGCDKLCVLVGSGEGVPDERNPLDYKTREVMIKSAYPDADVFVLRNHPSDKVWSAVLDRFLQGHYPEMDAVLYGSRDSFIPYYSGSLEAHLVETTLAANATELRKVATETIPDSEDFRKGVLYAHTRQGYPTSFQAVDIAIRHTLEPKVLVGRKAGETAWRFPGGFVDPSDNTLELAVKREAREEVGYIEIDEVKYVGSFRIDDYRYRSSKHKIMTALFSALYIYGPIRANDDLEEVRWQTYDGLVECLVEEHKQLGEAFLKTIQ